ncbi:tRNA threonylcarbamoyladenosine dehydratase [Haematococcus lacustris]|uniref:tRNA threonylcarbamoyladenosine dehydratase n=1 Tax=Haematococcus lacustris TaxID=44745 RepID=A0A699ZKY6_HAELA|nr:tRNA threonylcarbamoyladenosine dehydratase [Haematococcus lacustris]
MGLCWLQEFLTPEGAEALLLQGCRGAGGEGVGPFDWVVDAIDSVRPKQLLIASAFKLGIPLVTAMGAGGRLDPGRVRVVPLSTTFNDSFAALLRKGLRRLGVDLDQHSLAMAERGQSFKRECT